MMISLPKDLENYLRYRKIVSLLTKEKMTTKEIILITGFPTSSVYRILRNLLKFGFVEIISFKKLDFSKKESVYGIKPFGVEYD